MRLWIVSETKLDAEESLNYGDAVLIVRAETADKAQDIAWDWFSTGPEAEYYMRARAMDEILSCDLFVTELTIEGTAAICQVFTGE